MAEENPTWGYTRMRGALKNVGHRVGRSTIARILKAHGIPPVPERPTSWHTFLRAHWGAITGADFFTTEVWTWRGLVTYYTLFVIDLASRRVQIVGSTPHPDGSGALIVSGPGHSQARRTFQDEPAMQTYQVDLESVSRRRAGSYWVRITTGVAESNVGRCFALPRTDGVGLR